MPDTQQAGNSCVQPARGPIVESTDNGADAAPVQQKEQPKVLARVGQPAPDFEAVAYYEDGFKPVKLSDYSGKWVVVCFYPGDFTFV
jgi:hypothetical protein